ncbi:MAG: GIY-YIG nuclease family protein [Terracidiphilus sp.]
MDEKVYCAYIVASRSHTLYIGMTGDLLRRVFQHKQKTYEGFSATYNCNRLVWFERFTGPVGAIAREKQLKGWTRAKKIALIEKDNPTWRDLSEGWYAVDPTVGKRG